MCPALIWGCWLQIRKAYGLGVQAMCGGSSLVPFLCATWPTGEFAGMGIEGSVKLGQRKQLEEIEVRFPTNLLCSFGVIGLEVEAERSTETLMLIQDPEERLAFFNKLVDRSYESAKAVYAVTNFGAICISCRSAVRRARLD